jgi:hypothetical protein
MADEASEDKTKKTRKKRKVVKLPENKRLAVEKTVEQRVLDNPNVFRLPVSKRTIDDLTNYFIKQKEGVTKILPKEKRRYVIYLRKSTDSEDKQVRSLPDQRIECSETWDLKSSLRLAVWGIGCPNSVDTVQ